MRHLIVRYTIVHRSHDAYNCRSVRSFITYMMLITTTVHSHLSPNTFYLDYVCGWPIYVDVPTRPLTMFLMHVAITTMWVSSIMHLLCNRPTSPTTIAQHLATGKYACPQSIDYYGGISATISLHTPPLLWQCKEPPECDPHLFFHY